MRIYIIEDEQSNSDRLCRLIKGFNGDYEIVGVAANNASACTYFAQNPDIDLILADIQLSDGLSFEALKRAPYAVPIIFTTAFDHYAIQAFKFNSIDYLLKPIQSSELQSALNKVAQPKQSKSFTTTELTKLLDIVQTNNIHYRERFLIAQGSEEFLVLPVSEVSLIGIHDGLVCIYTLSGKDYPINLTLDELEKQLNPMRFMRVNRQYIVHAADVHKLSTHFFGKLRVHMKSFPSVEIVVSKDKAASVKRWLGS